jgi:hypothetical protein
LRFRNPFQNRWSREWGAAVFQTASLNFAGDRVETRTSVLANTTLLNFWELSYRLSYSPETLNDRLLRGGPFALRPTETLHSLELSTDGRKPIIFNVEALRTTDRSGRDVHSVELEIDWRPLPQARIRVGPSYQGGITTGQYVQSVTDATATATYGRRYVFADVRQREARLDTRVDWTFSPWLSLQLFLQPFASAGEFSRFKEFTTPRAFAFAEYGRERGVATQGANGLTVDPDGRGPATAFLIPRQDFTVRALRGNAVLRWEYQPGSSLFFVWSQQRQVELDAVNFGVANQVGRAFADPGRHVFLIKYSRWIGR